MSTKALVGQIAAMVVEKPSSWLCVRDRVRQVWLGVLAALGLAFSFGAVLTFTAANLSTGPLLWSGSLP